MTPIPETRVFSTSAELTLFENRRKLEGLLCFLKLLQVFGNKTVYEITYQKV